jgi:hypothetical protein
MERCRRERPAMMLKVAGEWYSTPRAAIVGGNGVTVSGRREW